MRNVTFAVDESLLDAAREQAAAENSSLNEQFRLWLQQYARKRQTARAMAVVDRIAAYADSGGRRFSRDERNARG
jgi:hypothetical protein